MLHLTPDDPNNPYDTRLVEALLRLVDFVRLVDLPAKLGVHHHGPRGTVPCPHCGGNAEIERHPQDDLRALRWTCHACGCQAGAGVYISVSLGDPDVSTLITWVLANIEPDSTLHIAMTELFALAMPAYLRYIEPGALRLTSA